MDGEFEKSVMELAEQIGALNKRTEELEDIILAAPDIIWTFDLGAMSWATRSIACGWLALIYGKRRELDISRREARQKDPLAA